MESWNNAHPKDFKELFDFYHVYVKALYSYVQTSNILPSETLFELNAALDHISRHWAHGEAEANAVADAYGHLKRSCLDVFKMKVVETRTQYDQVMKLDTSIIEYGAFDQQYRQLFNEIRTGAAEARRCEGERDATNSVPAFQPWESVFINCLKFESEFFLHAKVPWAKRRGFLQVIRQQWIGFVVGVISSIVATAILILLTQLASK